MLKKFLVSIPIVMVKKLDTKSYCSDSFREDVWSDLDSAMGDLVKVVSFEPNKQLSEIELELKQDIKMYNYNVSDGWCYGIVISMVETYVEAENEVDAQVMAEKSVDIKDINDDFTEAVYFDNSPDQVYDELLEHFVSNGIQVWDCAEEFGE